MRTFYIETYGCQMNKYDSELVSSILGKEGYESTDNIDETDILLINTCAVREHATERVINKLKSYEIYKKRGKVEVIGIIGCMPQHDRGGLKEKLPFIDILAGPDSYRRLPEMLGMTLSKGCLVEDTDLNKDENYDLIFPSRQAGTNAFIAIMRGCNNFCSYCVVPYTRGRERSRSLESIIDETKKTVADGFSEITLLGQNVNSYKYGDIGFPELLRQVSKVDGLKRLRFATSHPKDLSDELITVMAECDNICPSLHLPFQSGSNRILEMMNRGYTIESYKEKINKIKKAIPDIALTADIIVGFPSETEEDFEDTLQTVKDVSFDNSFTFIYSERENTAAEKKYTDDIDRETKVGRLQRLSDLQKEVGLKNLQSEVGKIREVLVENISKKRDWQLKGRTVHNRIVIFDKKDDLKTGDYVNVKIVRAEGVTLFGEIVN